MDTGKVLKVYLKKDTLTRDLFSKLNKGYGSERFDTLLLENFCGILIESEQNKSTSVLVSPYVQLLDGDHESYPQWCSSITEAKDRYADVIFTKGTLGDDPFLQNIYEAHASQVHDRNGNVFFDVPFVFPAQSYLGGRSIKTLWYKVIGVQLYSFDEAQLTISEQLSPGRIKLAYIGDSSNNLARVIISDLVASEGLSGEVAFYDTDLENAERNTRIGEYFNEDPLALSRFDYRAYKTIDDALYGADFVIISVFPGTFQEMNSDIHAPEKYGIYQSAGDSAGPGGILRAMRTVPLYEDLAKKIKQNCPDAWVISFSEPMSICVKALYDIFPEIKAFGCCNEVFHAQELLCCVLKEIKGIETDRKQIFTDICGVNHFTWITRANYGKLDLLSLLPEFIDRFYEEGYYELDKHDTFAYGSKVKLDLFNRFGALGAAGDRHLAEFVPGDRYLRDPKTVRDWQFGLTTVDIRKEKHIIQMAENILIDENKMHFELKKSNEEAIDILQALLGFKTVVSNVNTVNRGQMSQLPIGSIVETNCVFSNDNLCPVIAKELPVGAYELVKRANDNIEMCYEGIKLRDLSMIYASFRGQALCDSLSDDDCFELFKEMCYNTRGYLDLYFNIDDYFINKKPSMNSSRKLSEE